MTFDTKYCDLISSFEDIAITPFDHNTPCK